MPQLCPLPLRKGVGPSLALNATLPAELTARAVTRLGWVAAIVAGLFVVMFVVFHPTSPELRELRPFFAKLVAAAVALCGAMFAITRWSRLPSQTVLDIGLVFEVAAAMLISLADSRIPIQPGALIQGQPAIGSWVTMFALVVPASPGKALLASLATAATGPLALLINVAVNGVPMVTAQQMLMLYLMPFLLAIASVALSRYIYDLGKELSSERQLGSYQLIERIGQGGMGEVWRARHRVLVRDAAVKLIRLEALGSGPSAGAESLERRFELEAQATAALQSPHTVNVYDYGTASDGSFYYVMELLDGVDLEDFVKRFGPMPAARVVHVLRQICDSLAEAHQAGLTHRDIKPRNVFLCRLGLNFDYVKVLDFGLVKAKHADETQLTRQGVAAGTPAYMAPELALGNAVDGRTDLYAVGCVAYWLLTGGMVFEAASAIAIAMEHVQTRPAPPSARTEMEIPAELEEVVLRCLEKEPQARPQSARELSRLLAALPVAQWGNDRAEDWWRVHMPARAKLELAAAKG